MGNWLKNAKTWWNSAKLQSFEQSYKNFWSFVDSNDEVFLNNQSNLNYSVKNVTNSKLFIKAQY